MEISMSMHNTFNVENVARLIKAWYGPEEHKWSSRWGYDVTRELEEYLVGQKLRTQTVDFADFGPDPAPNKRKILLIRLKSVDESRRHDHEESIAPHPCSPRPSPRRPKSGGSWYEDREESPTPRGGIQRVVIGQHHPRDIENIDETQKKHM